METIKFNVKEKSILEFFSDKLINKSKDSNSHFCDDTQDLNLYNLFKDKIYIKNDKGINECDIIMFEMFDISKISKSNLTNHYKYKAEKYDDFALVLVLIDFKISKTEDL